MTIDKRDTIDIPKFWIIIGMPLIVSAVIGYATSRFTAGKSETKIELNEKATMENVRRIESIEASKVGTVEFTIIQGQLNRIEHKLDGHLDKK